jgi:hypothetical protein
MHEFAYDFRRRGEFIEDLEPNKKSKRYRVGGEITFAAVPKYSGE